MNRRAINSHITGRFAGRLPLPPSLRYRNYLLYWIGLLASVLGFRGLEFAQFWQMHELTSSPLYLGFLGLAIGLPSVVLNLVGGVTADRFQRRRIVIVTQFGMAVPVTLLGVLTSIEQVTPVHVLAASALVAGLNAFNTPARLSLYPQYVDSEVLLSAVALNSAAWQTARVAAPAMAGVAIATVGTAAVYYAAGAGMLLLAVMMTFLPDDSRPRSDTRVFEDLMQGLRFIRQKPPFSFLIGITFVASFFGLSYVTLMPVFAVDILDVGAQGQGVLLAVTAVGSLLVTLIVGTGRSSPGHNGVLMSVGASSTALSLMAFVTATSFLRSYLLSLIAIFFVGASSALFVTSVMTSLQMLVPDSLRGRVMGFSTMMWGILPLGGLFLGVVADHLGASYAVAIGGVIVLVAVAIPTIFRAPFLRDILSRGHVEEAVGGD